eukprot:TRINITY_DN18021_c0_g1_i1.p1 TRINITY_DN18021_c0_g1~~TRINITY_DN18021_c0_g1_i1.p1  ORF type:complete len:464 (-),score=148.02 TRINITY_DN18021_c0_g1_i1:362-1753(-)
MAADQQQERKPQQQEEAAYERYMKRPPSSWLGWTLDVVGNTLGAVNMSPIYFDTAALRQKIGKLQSLKSELVTQDMIDGITRSWSIVCHCLEKNTATCPPMGIFMMNRTFLQMTDTCINAAQYFLDHPEIATEPLMEKRVIFVSGLPRTGTTMTQKLIGADPANRAALLFEMCHMVNPFPPCKSKDERDKDPRLQQLESLWYGAEQLVPGYFNRVNESHYTAPNEPDEELAILYWLGLSLMHIPRLGKEYCDYFIEPNKEFAYKWLKVFFQTLHHAWAPKGYWILKSPVHALWLDSLHAVFPDAKVVFTHRDPLDTIPSFCALEENYISHLFKENTYDKNEMSEISLRLWKTASDRTVEWQKRTDQSVYFNIPYQAITREPLATAARLYERFGIPMSDAAREAMAEWLRTNPQGKYGRAHYSLEQYGLHADELRPLFVEYKETLCKYVPPPAAATTSPPSSPL